MLLLKKVLLLMGKMLEVKLLSGFTKTLLKNLEKVKPLLKTLSYLFLLEKGIKGI
jgi:hypothetical protein